MKIIKDFLTGKSIKSAVYTNLNRGDLIYLKDGSMRIIVYREPSYYAHRFKVKTVEDFFKTSTASAISNFTTIDHFVHKPNLYKIFGLKTGQILEVGDKRITSNGNRLHPNFRTNLNRIVGISKGKLLVEIENGAHIFLDAFEIYPPNLEDNYELF